MRFNLSKIQFSRNDIRSGITIPTKLTEEVAEFLGIMVGDGHVGIRQNKIGKKSYKHYELYICGNLKDYDHHARYINSLIHKIFNIKFRVITRTRDNTVILRKDSKAIVTFLRNDMGIPQKKDEIRIPNCIMEAPPAIKAAFIRGLADADFTLTVKKKEGTYYPVVQGCSKSEQLMIDICAILKQLNIKHCSLIEESYYKKRNVTYIRSRVYVNGRKNINNWFTKIGFANPRHLEKYKRYLQYWRERNQKKSNNKYIKK